MDRERAPAWYPGLFRALLHLVPAVWILGACLTLTLFGNRGQPQVLTACLVVWASMWLPYVLVCRQRPQAGFGAKTILGWALLFRLALVFAGLPTDTASTTWFALRDDLSGEVAGYEPFLLWDNDVWRYLWDGHVAAAGVSPYRITPQQVLDASDNGESWAEELVDEGPWLDVLDAASYRDHPSVYPPLALRLFRVAHALAPGSVFVWKLQLIGLDLLGCVLFLFLLRRTRRSETTLLWLAWNPLLLKEVAGSGHLEGALIPLLVATLLALSTRRHGWAATSLAAAVLLKLWPLLLAPAVLLRAPLRASLAFGAAISVVLLPWINDLSALFDALRSFGGTWVFNPGAWLLAEWIAKGLGAGNSADSWARLLHLGLTALVCGGLALRALRSRREGTIPLEVARDWLWILVAYLLLAPTVMPWYLTVALPMAALLRFWPWHVTGAASLLSYLIYISQSESTAVLALEHTIIAVALLAWWLHRHRHSALPGGSAEDERT